MTMSSSMKTCSLAVALRPAADPVVGLLGARLGRAASHTLCTILGVAISFVAVGMILRDVLAGHTFNGEIYTWMTSRQSQVRRSASWSIR